MMEIIDGQMIEKMTGYRRRAMQERWFKERGYTYEVDSNGNLWTTDDWMNGKDKYQAMNDDGFNLEGIQRAS